MITLADAARREDELPVEDPTVDYGELVILADGDAVRVIQSFGPAVAPHTRARTRRRGGAVGIVSLPDPTHSHRSPPLRGGVVVSKRSLWALRSPRGSRDGDHLLRVVGADREGKPRLTELSLHALRIQYLARVKMLGWSRGTGSLSRSLRTSGAGPFRHARRVHRRRQRASSVRRLPVCAPSSCVLYRFRVLINMVVVANLDQRFRGSSQMIILPSAPV
jgi:hypothetical protein